MKNAADVRASSLYCQGRPLPSQGEGSAMRCASCNADNPREAATCAGCGAALGRRVKRRGIAEESDSAFGGPVEPPNRSAVWAYRVAVLGLVPGLGLGLGPAALVWGLAAGWRGRRDPEFTAPGPPPPAGPLRAPPTPTQRGGPALRVRRGPARGRRRPRGRK